MQFKALLNALIYVGLTLTLSACSKSDSKKGEGRVPNNPQAEVCSAEGVWSRCLQNGALSVKADIQITGSHFYEKAQFYSNSDCSGIADNELEIEAEISFGEPGVSTLIAGGTDVTLAPSSDFAGCGAGAPVYSIVKFNDTCTEFLTSDRDLSCDPNNRGTIFLSQPLVKQ